MLCCTTIIQWQLYRLSRSWCAREAAATSGACEVLTIVQLSIYTKSIEQIKRGRDGGEGDNPSRVWGIQPSWLLKLAVVCMLVHVAQADPLIL